MLLPGIGSICPLLVAVVSRWQTGIALPPYPSMDPTETLHLSECVRLLAEVRIDQG